MGHSHGATRLPGSWLPRGSPVPESRAGMTLIELLVALALVAILLSASTLAISAALDRREDPLDALRRVLAEARRTAAARESAVHLELDPSGDYRLLGTDTVLDRGRLPAALPSGAFTTTLFAGGTSSGGTFCLGDAVRSRRVRIDRVTSAPQDSGGC